ncbi:RagB/SusD family nutrient uptake outer membrane protein [Amycolatopsis rhizosphaerae]|uniref:RagB/SusD family nutrient uptake outer membrane protein n=1 Tax=Amycolatopsis rhizosphaerae TaxID=2053003 RepID=A0A558CPF7_9PSEU|nr:RagB/SusD family nutrient uptake outer membrane protein [Amycolatopsis rhizosphaerae]TVT50656.1 RagB/SusD family nutrient uptake outer membrane protein [Amycolatopsis rhizosphaerae]
MRSDLLLSAAVAAYTPKHAREVALYRTWIAEAYARSGNLEAAQDTINQARQTADRLTSARLTLRVGIVERLVEQPG